MKSTLVGNKIWIDNRVEMYSCPFFWNDISFLLFFASYCIVLFTPQGQVLSSIDVQARAMNFKTLWLTASHVKANEILWK